MTDDGFMGPPWQMDWTLKAQAVRDSRPLRSNDPKGRRIFFFDDCNGWLIYDFVPRTEDPQIVVDEVFRQ